MGPVGSELSALDRMARLVRVATRPFLPTALAGLGGTAIILASLAPWLLSSDEGASAWWALGVLGVAGPVRLLWHRRRLRRGLGDPRRVLAEAGDLRRALPARAAPPPSRDEPRRRGVLAGLRGLRALRALRLALAATGLADRARQLYAPLLPPALWLTALALLAVAVTVVAAPVVALASVALLLAD